MLYRIFKFGYKYVRCFFTISSTLNTFHKIISFMAWFLLFLHFFLFHFLSFSSSFSFLCHDYESSALLHFKSSFTIYTDYNPCGYPPIPLNVTWKNGTDCCSWYGVTCDTISGHVIGLDLGCEGLQGIFHPNSTLFHLSHLQTLNLSNNEVEIPTSLSKFGGFMSLEYLDLSFNFIEGEIPISFSNLTHLTYLNLEGNHLNGSIPFSLLTLPLLTFLLLDNNELSGQIPNAFQMSNNILILDLSHNKIGGELPTSLSNLQHLIYLNLKSNSFSGQIPDVFGGMTELLQLSLAFNRFEGQIPSSLFTLTWITELSSSHNKLEGPLPNKITGFQKLTYLNLDDNLLNGTIPSSLLSLPSLEYLKLSKNRLTGHISQISSYSFETLILRNNMLQGNIPESVFNLTSLTTLDLSSNNLSGFVNFQLFSKLTSLQFLSLSWNSQLSLNFQSNVNYSFPYLQELQLSSVNLIEFHKSQGEFSDLMILDLSNNKLNGRMPNWLLEKNFLQFLNLSQNFFTSIDQWINVNRSNGYFYALDLGFNLLDGEIPFAVCNISSLAFLNLGYNNLTGIIPQCLAESPLLQVLNLQMNTFRGTLTSNFSQDSRIVTLNLYGNQLEGPIPRSLSRCKKLEFLNLGSNKIEDSFPDWLQTLKRLKVLVLPDNKLHGPIENKTTKHPFPGLVIFDISGNNFSGLLPKAYLKNYKSMMIVPQDGESTDLEYMDMNIFHFTTYYDSVTVATKGINITLVKIPTMFVSIDFSRNRFEGEIPDVIGELDALKGLNLSHNRLTGPIPNSLGNLTNLESLDLSSNMFVGVIPVELTNLNGLEVLDLTNNHLVGQIPQGKQFDTFSNDSYEGNSGLCGLPLSKKCGPEQDSPPSPNNFWNEKKFGFGWKPVAIGYGCGFVIGIGIGYYSFLIGKPRWLVMIFGGQPRRRVTRRTRTRRNHGTTMNQMVQMS